jgi:hypothetical protein
MISRLWVIVSRDNDSHFTISLPHYLQVRLFAFLRVRIERVKSGSEKPVFHGSASPICD